VGSNRGVGRLSAIGVQRQTKPGMYADGGGLYLQVRGATSKSWIFRYRFAGRERELGLGSLQAVSLGEARDLAAAARKLKVSGVDPVDQKQQARDATRAEVRKRVPTFDEAVTTYLKTNSAGWKNAKHAQQWTNTLKAYATPHFGDTLVSDIDLHSVLAALEPIWTTKPETASRVRGRIETVLDWAAVLKHRTGENPARWRGNLDKVLPPLSKVRKVQHHSALPYKNLPEFFAELAERQAVSALALQFAILTAGRTTEVLGARWCELDLDGAIWTVPATRMKAGKDHRVPLTSWAIAILAGLPKASPEALVFADQSTGRQLSINAMPALLKRMNRADVTVHGFRSSFRDWAAEETQYQGEVVEAALAHTISSKVEAAYRRGDLVEKRRALMSDWSAFATRLVIAAKREDGPESMPHDS
jgi:integrase